MAMVGLAFCISELPDADRRECAKIVAGLGGVCLLEAGFVPASSFSGVRPGYSYKTGEEGLGYYRDSSSSSSSTSASAGTGAGAGGADFGSVNDDMSVVNCLYRLAVGAVRSVLTALGFTEVRRRKSHVISQFRTFVTKR